jgi:REP element-mobilizing transposase RayT
VTARTYQNQLRLTPGPLVNQMVESTLIRAAQRCSTRVIVAATMGNHTELVVQTPQDNLDDFMEEYLKELSHRLNRMRGIEHTNFPRRYDSTELGDADTIAQRIAHILCNPVRARLVAKVDAWPGFSTMTAHRTGQTTLRTRLPSRRHAEQLAREGCSPEISAEMKWVETELARPPIWPELDDREVQERICELVDAEEARLRAEIERRNGRVLGRSRVNRERWCDRPDAVRWRKRRRYAAADKTKKDMYESFYEATRRQYRRAARMWRDHRKWGDYPPGTFPPGWQRCLPTSAEVGPMIPWAKIRPN